MKTTAPKEPSLPSIPLSRFPEATKDFLIGKSLPGKTIPQVLMEILNEEAIRAGFKHTPA